MDYSQGNEMKSVLSILVFVAATIAFSNDRRPERQQITTKQIANADIIGAIGVPFGVCVKIKATLTRSDSNAKGDEGVYFLTVTEADGQRIDPPLQMKFNVHRFATKNVKIANNDFGLYELSTGKKTGSLSGEQVTQLRKRFVGTPFSLTVYETGTFSGIPSGIPTDVLIWQDKAFHFEHALIVVDQQK